MHIFPWNTVQYVSVKHMGTGISAVSAGTWSVSQEDTSPAMGQSREPAITGASAPNAQGLVFHCHTLQNHFVVPT